MRKKGMKTGKTMSYKVDGEIVREEIKYEEDSVNVKVAHTRITVPG